MKNKDRILSEPRWRIIAWQYVSYVLVRTYFALSRSIIINDDSLKIDTTKRYVISSNHVSRIDPFFVTAALGWKNIKPLIPCRFIAATKFISIRWLQTPMRQLGAYPSHPYKNWSYGLDASLRLLHDNSTIVIFPQGRMTHDKSLSAKRGVSVLSKEPETLIIPVHIDYKKTRFLPKYTIITGNSFNASAMSSDEIMQKSYSLVE